MAEEVNYYIKNLHHRPNEKFIHITDELRHKMTAFLLATVKAIEHNNFENIEVIKIARDDVKTYINQQLAITISLLQGKKPIT
jgi:hypothetical protein